ncbi:hypothetical protein ACFSC3_12645 [Sphingomonas floccifaciens]|uniref:Uncharacterized protein n=1 Tax=Sphingomonas floccifaciens TaxID=1844115 RepID=A0ABW4NEK4_9SPHN
MQRATSAQLVTAFDPNSEPLIETTFERAIMQWSSLDRVTQADALLIVSGAGGERRVYGRAAIAEMAGKD